MDRGSSLGPRVGGGAYLLLVVGPAAGVDHGSPCCIQSLPKCRIRLVQVDISCIASIYLHIVHFPGGKGLCIDRVVTIDAGSRVCARPRSNIMIQSKFEAFVVYLSGVDTILEWILDFNPHLHNPKANLDPSESVPHLPALCP